MKNYVICPFGNYLVSKPSAIVPKVELYIKDYQPKIPLGAWGMVVVPSGVVIPQAMIDDSQIFIIPESQLDSVPSNQERNRTNAFLASTDISVQLVAGETYRQSFVRIGTAMGHTEEFILGL